MLRLVAALTSRAGDEGEREEAEPGVEQALRECAATLRPALEVVALVVSVEERLREPPRGVGPEPETERDEDDRAVRLLRDQAQSSLAVGRRAADTECDEHGQHADEPVGEALRD